MIIMLQVNFSGLQLKSPIILASGILGVSFSSMKRVIDAGAGAVTSKSIGLKPRIGYGNPSIIEVYRGTFLNAVGLGNPGIDHFIKEITEIKKYSLPLIVSVFGETIDAYIEVATKAEKAGADAIELNVSCPHANVSSIGMDKDLTSNLVSKVKNQLKIPIFVKLNPNVTDLTEIAFAAEKAGANAVVAINTIASLKIDVNTHRPILAHGSGGLSGKAIHPIAVKHVFDLYKKLTIPIIACGGVDSWQDIVEFFLAGASAVQIGTALYRGVNIIKDILENLIKYLKKNRFKSISDLKGLSHQFKTQEVPDYV
ncbi:MAG: dihydroorotate dehydrogenase [Candidatus Lokiarchaeota archaeon]|nr:dihydroorotate dehydrogenase [Candidatus Lokiarchaeota archaeon]MBD3339405.1 dihydroorotate dehydrogenase [Candidatus Lokiarchaeota archaeon]